MLNTVKQFFLNKELKKNNSRKQFTEWTSVKNIGVVILNDSNSISSVNSFIKDSNKNVDLIVFSNDKTGSNKSAALSFNLKDFRFTGLPTTEALAKLKSKNYDVVICCDNNNVGALKAISTLVNAKCIVGMASVEYKNYFDIIIEDRSGDIGNFLKQALKYLMMIKAT